MMAVCRAAGMDGSAGPALFMTLAVTALSVPSLMIAVVGMMAAGIAVGMDGVGIDGWAGVASSVPSRTSAVVGVMAAGAVLGNKMKVRHDFVHLWFF
ncbi:MAG: hypothetical protein GY874_06035 [Desulfobacteraceae bacterium]|nr:hypothetical protein [Desulfobacteraceae bacterium]